jgi:hypothetical protein
MKRRKKPEVYDIVNFLNENELYYVTGINFMKANHNNKHKTKYFIVNEMFNHFIMSKYTKIYTSIFNI